jgi:hypothetical protein
VDGVRQQLLAGAGLAQQQHGAVGLRHAPRLALDLQRRRAAADEAGDGVLGPALLGQLAPRVVQLALQPDELGCISGCIVVSGWSSSTMPRRR